jgi:hypothetical protein
MIKAFFTSLGVRFHLNELPQDIWHLEHEKSYLLKETVSRDKRADIVDASCNLCVRLHENTGCMRLKYIVKTDEKYQEANGVMYVFSSLTFLDHTGIIRWFSLVSLIIIITILISSYGFSPT